MCTWGGCRLLRGASSGPIPIRSPPHRLAAAKHPSLSPTHFWNWKKRQSRGPPHLQPSHPKKKCSYPPSGGGGRGGGSRWLLSCETGRAAWGRNEQAHHRLTLGGGDAEHRKNPVRGTQNGVFLQTQSGREIKGQLAS